MTTNEMKLAYYIHMAVDTYIQIIYGQNFYSRLIKHHPVPSTSLTKAAELKFPSKPRVGRWSGAWWQGVPLHSVDCNPIGVRIEYSEVGYWNRKHCFLQISVTIYVFVFM